MILVFFFFVNYSSGFTMQMKKSGIHNNPTNPMIKKEGFQDIYHPKSDNQKFYIKTIENINIPIVIATGPAGTGKTLLACISAIKYLIEKKVNKIIITRPVVPVEEEIGFLPGKMERKMDPWTRPIFDIFGEYFDHNEMKYLLDSGVIEICPIGYMRGRTFKHSFIIADEMQNSSPSQMKMLLTRIGKQSKMVITGDIHQSDSKENGLKDFTDRLSLYNNRFINTQDFTYNYINDTFHEKYTTTLNNNYKIKQIKLTNKDIEREEVIKDVLDIYNFQYNKNDNNNNNEQKEKEDDFINKLHDKIKEELDLQEKKTEKIEKKLEKKTEKIEKKVEKKLEKKVEKKVENKKNNGTDDAALIPKSHMPKNKFK